MTDLHTLLQRELAQLELELKRDPRYLKMVAIRTLLDLYRDPQLTDKRRPLEGSKIQLIREEVKKLVEPGPVHRRDILDHLMKMEIMGTEKDPMQRLAIHLNQLPEFRSYGGGRWGVL